jgi:hypothetical protein
VLVLPLLPADAAGRVPEPPAVAPVELALLSALPVAS